LAILIVMRQLHLLMFMA